MTRQPTRSKMTKKQQREHEAWIEAWNAAARERTAAYTWAISLVEAQIEEEKLEVTRALYNENNKMAFTVTAPNGRKVTIIVER